MIAYIAKKIGVGFLSGIGLGIGFLAVIFASETYFGGANDPESRTWEDDPPGLAITNHSTRPNMGQLTIVGEIENRSAFDWDTVWITAKILADDALVNNCEDTVRNLPANSTKGFEIRCYDVSGSGLPDNVRYELAIRTSVRPESE